MIGRLLGKARGIRPRMVLIVTFVALLATVAATGANYVSARRTVLATTQDHFMQQLRDDVDRLAPDLRLPLDQAALDELAGRLGRHTVVVQGNLTAENAENAIYLDLEIPADLRATVRDGSRIVFQRVEARHTVMLVVGMPVLTTDEHFQRHPSGLEVYGWFPLYDQQRQIQEFATNGWLTGAVAVPFAVIVAWLAASAVLRPVRRLRDGARSLARGDLTTRLPARGSDELAELARTFNDSAASLEASVGELRRMEADSRRFVADVSHELRTPLAAMTAVNEVLDEDGAGLPGDAGTAARLISSETKKLARLVDDLIEISRFDSGTARLDRQETDLGELITGTLRTRQWGDRVETDLPSGIVAEVDGRRVDVIVANLVGNALRHGGPPVRVRLRSAGGQAVVEVTDNGPGLPEAVLPHVFARFYKADAARTRSEGSGLGLSIAMKNAALHGGIIEAGNQPGGGAKFTLRLPLEVS
ncbi:HAMP domain-containing sensor histidine kinase [Saccharopolyspora shandongensis]|uniref:HAMP domain-containing sensor histidine kinase n=1 Tax=Saccharopolyspora shandongensis TaxID=418495 RepID=UPI00344906B0